MHSGTVIIAGSAGSGKTTRLVATYRQALTSGGPGCGLWLAPTRLAAADIRGRLLGPDMPGCFSPNCCTFEQFSQAILEASGRPIRPISGLMKRTLLRRLIDDALAGGQLTYFAPIAEKSGLVDQVDQFIRELKRLEIWPEEFLDACRRRGLSAKDRELWHLYNEYQRLLNEHHLFDAEGRFWSARALLRDGQRKPFERVRLVVVDGFTDFTRTQHEVLDILAERVESLAISLPLEPEPRRRDLFAKTARTLDELRRRHERLTIEELTGRSTAAWPAMHHLERELFRNPRETRPADDTCGLEILAASGQLGEIELVGRRVKRLLAEGDDLAEKSAVRPGDVLIVFRSLQDSAGLVREVFDELGIPTAIEFAPALDRAPIVGALLNLLRLQLHDWPFRDVLAWLSHNYFCPSWPEWEHGRAAAAAEHLVRRLQIPAGRGQLLKQLQRWASQPRPEPPPGAAQDGRVDRRVQRWERANLASPLLAKLDQALEKLPKKASPTQWAAAIEALAEDVGLLRSMAKVAGTLRVPSPQHTTSQPRDEVAWQKLLRSLRAQERLAGWLDEPAFQWTLEELVEQLTDIAAAESLPHEHSDDGRVRIVSASSARSISAPYVFLAGLSEKAFPQPDREDRIYGEADIARLAEAGLPLAPRAERSQEEMLLFYEVLTRATRRLWLSYPALDEKAQPLSPSPYLTEVERACGEGKIVRHKDLQLSPLPQSLELCSPRELRVKAVAQGLAGDASLLGGLCQRADDGPLAQNLCAALRLADARRGRAFGPFEGLLEGEAARGQLAGRYGPERCWSPSQLEQYASCPYQFFLERVLRLEPLDDLALEVDYLTRGRMLHGALATLHRRINQRRGPSSPCADDEDDYQREVSAILDELLAALGPESPLEGALREVDRRLLSEWLAHYRQQHRDYEEKLKDSDQPFVPRYFEVSFGPSNSQADPEQADLDLGASDSLSSPAPFELSCGDQHVRLSGRIDRIDVGVVAGQTVFNIVDYKSGSAARLSNKAIYEGRALQLPLYAMAVESLLAKEGAVPWRAAYWFVKGAGYKEALSFFKRLDGEVRPSDEWETLRGQLMSRVLSLVLGIRGGQFPMLSADDECTGYCPFSTVCRVQQVRSLEKTWTPPLVELP